MSTFAPLLRKSDASTSASKTTAPRRNVARPVSAGQPLPDATRTFFESRFGADFRSVRVHTDANAAADAAAIRARAFTCQEHIVFGKGSFEPSSFEGRRLLAHELAHVTQQRLAQAPSVVQRKIGDNHDLTAPRFKLDAVLEAVYDNERTLRVGDRGPAVVKLQQALLDSGMELPKFGADGKFGPETKAAVEDFQRATGLTGSDIDGTVGPTTMGFLDQAFSAGPTPAGTSKSATKGCPVMKTVSVDLVTLDGATLDPSAQLERANTIFNQCCVHLTFGNGASLTPQRTRALLGGDTQLDDSPSCGAASSDELALAGAAQSLGLKSRIRAFFVATTRSGRPYSVPPYCAGGAAAPLLNTAYVTNNGSIRGLAHEIGHILLNSGAHPSDPLNLMSPAGSPPGQQLTPADCTTIFNNA